MDIEKIKMLLSYTSTPVILEIGANNGSNTVELMTVPDCPLVVCFEPDNRAFEQLLSNKAIAENCRLLRNAVCNVDGPVAFNVSSGTWPGSDDDQWDKSGSLMTPKEHLKQYPWCKFEQRLSVQGIRLDTFMCNEIEHSGIRKIDFIWADVQGGELLMIEGGKSTFENKVHYLYTEYSTTELYEGSPGLKEICDALPGYEIIKDFGGDVLLHNKNFEG